MAKQDLQMFVIYEKPSDYPDQIVVRRWRTMGSGTMLPDPEPHALTDTVQHARDSIPCGMLKLRRLEQDDPVIVEVWL